MSNFQRNSRAVISIANPTAARVAPVFLPATKIEFESNLTVEHRTYFLRGAVGPETGFQVAGRDTAGDETTIVTYRGGDCLEEAPKSCRTASEQAPFTRRGQYAKATRAQLVHACAWIAAVIELASFYEARNGQNFCYALAGTLGRWGVPLADALNAAIGLCEATQDGQVDQRIDAVRRAFSRPRRAIDCGQEYALETLLGRDGKSVLFAVERHLRAGVCSDGQDYSQKNCVSLSPIYRETVSGTKGADQRPELRQLLIDARNRNFDKVIVWSVDRLARSIPHLVITLSELKDCKVDIVSINQGIDTSTPMGLAMWNLLGIFSEFEYNIRKERQALGIAKAKANGVKFGRKPMNWLMKERVLKLRAKGMGMNRIAKQLKVGTGAVVRVIKEGEGELRKHERGPV